VSHPLNFELNRILVHMESVLDLRIDRSDALVLVAEIESKLSSMQIDNELDASTLEILEESAEHLSEQIA
jgi:hypothetical protein